MSEDSDKTDADEQSVEVTTVARSVLTKYFDELAKQPGFANSAPRLRKLVLDNGSFAEPGVRSALFDEAP